MTTLINSTLSVDPAVVMDANWRFNRVDRRYIDDQIRAIEQHLVDALIVGRHGSWFSLDGASAAVVAGDTVCLASMTAGTVTKSTSVKLALAFSASGVVIQAANPGGKVFVAFGGILPPSITGLAAVAPGYVRVNTSTGRCERVASLSPGDYQMGYVDNAGWMQVAANGSLLTSVSLTSGVTGVLPASNGGSTAQALALDFTSTTSASAQDTNLNLAVAATDIWLVEFGLVWSLASGTSGCKFGISAPGAATFEGAAHGELLTGLSTYTSVRINSNALNGPFNTASAVFEGVWGSCRVKMDGATSGVIKIQVAPVGAVVLTVKAGSWMKFTKVTEN